MLIFVTISMLSTHLFVQNWSILHIVIDELSWSQYLGLDTDPVQRKHEGVKLLDRQNKTPCDINFQYANTSHNGTYRQNHIQKSLTDIYMRMFLLKQGYYL